MGNTRSAHEFQENTLLDILKEQTIEVKKKGYGIYITEGDQTSILWP
jgi:hypothetical protein